MPLRRLAGVLSRRKKQRITVARGEQCVTLVVDNDGRNHIPLRQELNRSRFEVVHRACNLYATAGFEVSKHRALFPDVGDSQ